MSTTLAYDSQTDFSHIKPNDTQFLPGGLRDFFVYRDLGVAQATHGKVIAHIAKANLPPENGTGWHYHVAEFQIVIMLKGWARFMYGDQPTLVSAGDCVHQNLASCITCSTTRPTWNTWKLWARQTLNRSPWKGRVRCRP